MKTNPNGPAVTGPAPTTRKPPADSLPAVPPRPKPATAPRQIDYAWVILGVAMASMFMSGPGQSYSVAAFIDPMLADLGVGRSRYSLAYLVATLISGASLPFVGRALDALGSRLLLPLVSLSLGFACLWMAGVRDVVGLYLGLTMVRCLGQGALTLISTWMVGQWFVRRRGTALGLLGLGSTLSFMAFPGGNLWLIDHYGWRGAWVALGVAVWALLCLPAVLLVRSRPGDLGHGAEQGSAGGRSRPDALSDEEAYWTARRACRTGSFWKVVSAMATSAMVSTGLVFHQVSLLADRGVTKEASLGLLGVQAFFACVMSLAGGYLADRIPPRRLLSASMVFMALAMVLVLAVKSPAAALPYSILLGMHTGIQRCAGAVTLIGFFGRTHLGAIKGIAMSLVIGASALGPLPLALAKDYLGRYDAALLVLLVFPLASALTVWSARPPGVPAGVALPASARPPVKAP